MNQIEILTLADNCLVHPSLAPKGLLGEHGLSFFMRFGNNNILFDTGTGATLCHNAKLLGLNLSLIDTIILSHAHNDHTGGLEDVLKAVGESGVNVFVHPMIFMPKYNIKSENKEQYNGLSKSRDAYERMGARFIMRLEPLEIFPGVSLLGPVPDSDWEPGRYYRKGDQLIPDYLDDEQFLALRTTQGLVLVLGCTHRGLEKTVEYALKVTGEKRLYGILGGLHLFNADLFQVKKLALFLEQRGISMVQAAHCTGSETTAVFYSSFPEKIVFTYVGKQTVFHVLD